MLADGLEGAFVGFTIRFGFGQPIACCDYDAVIAQYVRDGMTEEEAVEFFDYNVIGAWVGEGTPCYLRRMTLDEACEEMGQ